jgi:Dolichyl-phosphate-mannose-protein mannosyltransferase
MPARALAVLWMLAALWFLPGSLTTIEWVDEGHLVYFASRVAQGALLYRDVHHMYGPGTFFLNGALFRLFGTDLLVVRLALVVVKATLAVAVARVAGSAAGASGGLLAWGLLVAVWGSPLWIFATPYASIYQATFDLLALVALLDRRRRPRLRALMAGICLGLAATFKQTAGVLAGGGVIAFLLYDEPTRATPEAPVRRDPLGTAIRVVLLAAVFAVAARYGASFAERRALLILGTPLAVVLLCAAARVVRRGGGRDDLEAVGWTALGAALAPACYLVYYAAHGAAGALVTDTLWGLPQELSWRAPLAPFDETAATSVGVVVLGLAAVELTRRGVGARGVRRAVCWATAGAALALVAMAVGPGPVWPRWTWPGAAPLLYWLPTITVWLAVARPLWRVEPPAVTLPTFMAAALLLGLQPAADLPHVLLALPAFLPPLAALAALYADRALRAPPLAAAAVALVAAVLGAPFVEQLAGTIGTPRVPAVPYERATWVRDPGPYAEDTRALISYLERTPEDVRLLVVPSAQMVEFLAGRPSAVDREDFALYAGTYGQVPDDTARRLVDEDAAIARLERQRVLVVRRQDDPQAMRVFGRVFPKLLEYLERRFRPVAVFGPYQVLAPAPSEIGRAGLSLEAIARPGADRAAPR